MPAVRSRLLGATTVDVVQRLRVLPPVGVGFVKRPRVDWAVPGFARMKAWPPTR